MYIFKNVNEETNKPVDGFTEPVNEIFGLSKREKAGKAMVTAVKPALKEKAREIVKLAGGNPDINAIDWDTIEKNIDKMKSVGKMAVAVATYSSDKEAERFHKACKKTLGDEFTIYASGQKLVLAKILRVQMGEETIVIEAEEDDEEEKEVDKDEKELDKKDDKECDDDKDCKEKEDKKSDDDDKEDKKDDDKEEDKEPEEELDEAASEEEVEVSIDDMWASMFELQEAEFESYKAMITFDFAEMTLDKEDDRVSVLEEVITVKEKGLVAALKRAIDAVINFITTTAKNVSAKIKAAGKIGRGKAAIAYMKSVTKRLNEAGKHLIAFDIGKELSQDATGFRAKFKEKYEAAFVDELGFQSEQGEALASEILSVFNEFQATCKSYMVTMKAAVGRYENSVNVSEMDSFEKASYNLALSIYNQSIKKCQSWYNTGMKMSGVAGTIEN